MKGRVKFFDKKKGFGFIAYEGTDKDVFVHYTNIIADGFKNLETHQEVEFDIEMTDRGEKAVNVVVKL